MRARVIGCSRLDSEQGDQLFQPGLADCNRIAELNKSKRAQQLKAVVWH